VASDGASDPKTGKARFGWLLTDPTGNIMVQCTSPIYGNKLVSYQAEAYGALSPARFLYHIRHFFKLPTIHKYKYYCDNKSNILHDQGCHKRSTLSPNDTLVSAWDVLHQIPDTLSKANSQPAMIHVKSHQDEATPFEDLLLRAQLNCLADTLAGD
jgi:hypothetical protein